MLNVELARDGPFLKGQAYACLMYEDNASINNQSVRERFGIAKNNSAVASRIIADTLEEGLIKLSDEHITSKKYATYIPYYG